jgi:hypothetical protein
MCDSAEKIVFINYLLKLNANPFDEVRARENGSLKCPFIRREIN